MTYMLVAALECAALCGAAPSLRRDIEGAVPVLARLAAEWGPDAPPGTLPKQIAGALEGSVPVVYGLGATAPVALRWKSQVNENAKLPAFAAELPEADHNELSGWAGTQGLAPLLAVLLDDEGAEERLRRRIALTARAVARAGARVVEVPSFGATTVGRVAAGVMLGDFVSVYLATLRGVDPTPVEAIERFKRDLAGTGQAK